MRWLAHSCDEEICCAVRQFGCSFCLDPTPKRCLRAGLIFAQLQVSLGPSDDPYFDCFWTIYGGGSDTDAFEGALTVLVLQFLFEPTDRQPASNSGLCTLELITDTIGHLIRYVVRFAATSVELSPLVMGPNCSKFDQSS